jgi:uncharacterized protein
VRGLPGSPKPDKKRRQALPHEQGGSGGDRSPRGNRDRDASGRARNARPRDALGRPLPRSDTDSAAPRIPDDLVLPATEAVALAERLLRDDQPFHAHEVLEMLWKTGPVAERDLWQGLAQIAVGITHARRGNAQGAITLLRRGSDHVRGYTGQAHGVAVTRVLAAVDDLAARIDRDGLAAVADADLLLPLT